MSANRYLLLPKAPCIVTVRVHLCFTFVFTPHISVRGLKMWDTTLPYISAVVTLPKEHAYFNNVGILFRTQDEANVPFSRL